MSVVTAADKPAADSFPLGRGSRYWSFLEGHKPEIAWLLLSGSNRSQRRQPEGKPASQGREAAEALLEERI